MPYYGEKRGKKMVRKKQLIACMVASVLTVSSMHGSLMVLADEFIPDTEPPSDEQVVITEVEPCINIETEESGDSFIEETSVNIVFAEDSDEYYRTVSALPESERIIVDTSD
jgi:hypothetical protein